MSKLRRRRASCKLAARLLMDATSGFGGKSGREQTSKDVAIFKLLLNASEGFLSKQGEPSD